MKVRVFIDAENVSVQMALHFCSQLIHYGLVDIAFTVAGHNVSDRYMEISRDNVRIYQNANLKNSADAWLAMLVTKAIYREGADVIVLISGDKDFLPIADFATARGKKTILVIESKARRKKLNNKLAEYITNPELITLTGYNFVMIKEVFGEVENRSKNNVPVVRKKNGFWIMLPYFNELTLADFYKFMTKNGIDAMGLRAKQLAEKYGFTVENGVVRWPRKATGLMETWM